MSADERETCEKKILSSLKRRGLSLDEIVRVKARIAKASIRPLRVLLGCCISGGISTEELQKQYGYKQPPRAARDLKELGFAVKAKSGRTSDGRRMVTYYIDDFRIASAAEGRRNFTKHERAQLIERDGCRCFFCRGTFQPNELQIEHRVPFEIAGNSLHESQGMEALILACASCNRSKSWSCESCQNFRAKKIDTCASCYWTNPDAHTHVAERAVVRINVTFQQGEMGFKRFRLMNREAIRRWLES